MVAEKTAKNCRCPLFPAAPCTA